MPFPRLACAALVSVLLSACGGGDDDGAQPDAAPEVDAGPSPSCLEAAEHSDLPWIQANIFATSCAGFSSCHDADRPEGDLDLTTEASALAGLVDVDADLVDDMKRVVPGDPEASYLMVILGHYGEDDPRIDPVIGTMPQNNPLLCEPKRAAIGRWIESLAAAAPR